MPLRSPYEAAIGDRMHELHPSLRRYFSAIPACYIGVGEGVFAEVGTPRRWLWPLLRPLERRGVLYAGHARSVRFRVVNRTSAAAEQKDDSEVGVAAAGREGGAAGAAVARREIGTIGAAVARRELDLPGGTWVMHDSVTLAGRRVVDRIGAPPTIAASFDVGIEDAGLTLTSRSVGFRIGKVSFRLPGWLSPRVRLSERHDAVSGLQRVELTVDAPVIGRVYEYRGHFSYGIVREQADE